jgi:poly(A) polymerase
VDRLFKGFSSAGKQLYLVGGAVRDTIMGVADVELKDLDFATDALPDETLRILKEIGVPTYDVGKSFGTIGAVLYGAPEEGYPRDCQVTTFRKNESYPEGSRHPTVEYGDTIEEDLWRRDFSINSIALDSEGAYVDPYDGRGDIAAGVLRAVGDPLETLREDPLRMLRVGRFMSTLGFQPDGALRRATELRAETILSISRERWLQEMDKLLLGSHPAMALQFLADARILGMILPEVATLRSFHLSSPAEHKDIWAHTLTVVEQTEPNLVQRWAALIHDTGKRWTRRVDESDQVHFFRHEESSALLFEGIAARFRFDRARTRAIRRVIELHGTTAAYTPEWSDTAIRRLVGRAGEYLADLLAFVRADVTTQFEEKQQAAAERIAGLSERIDALERDQALRSQLPDHIGGTLIKALGLKPGPEIGDLVRRLEEAAINGDIPAAPTVEQCVGFLSKSAS